MKQRFFSIVALVVALAAARAAEFEAPPVPQSWQANGSAWADTVVTLEVARNQYDYTQPWTRKTRRLKKSGVVVGPREVLTTADQMQDRTLVRMQKHGRGQWAIAQVSWIDYPANLALVTTEEPGFWDGLKPAILDGTLPASGNMQIVRGVKATWSTAARSLTIRC